MINGELLNQAGISYEAGMQRFMNDRELYEDVLTAFVGEDLLERAEAAYAAKDNAMLMNVIHEAKGASGNAGLDALYIEASAFMKLLRNPPVTEDALTLGYNGFVNAYTAAKDGIKAALGK